MAVIDPDGYPRVGIVRESLPEDRDFWEDWGEPESELVEAEELPEGLEDDALVRLGINTPVYNEPVTSFDYFLTNVNASQNVMVTPNDWHDVGDVTGGLGTDPNLEVTGNLGVEGDVNITGFTALTNASVDNLMVNTLLIRDTPGITIDSVCVQHEAQHLSTVIEDLRFVLTDLETRVSNLEVELANEQGKVASLDNYIQENMRDRDYQ